MLRCRIASCCLLLCLLAAAGIQPAGAEQERAREDLGEKGPMLDRATHSRFSLGTGIGAKAGDRVHAMMKGTVRRFSGDAGNKTNFGRFVETAHSVAARRGGKTEQVAFYIIYSQLSAVQVRRDEVVRKGQCIGLAGGTGPFSDRSELVVCLYSESDEPYLRELTGSGPLYLLGYYWWDPGRILASSSQGR